MDRELRNRMLAYYDERASEYEEAYTLGTGTASITDPSVFTNEIRILEGVVRGFGQGHLLDLACGTGFWLPHYLGNCSHVTLFDQSESMLAECRLKVRGLGAENRCSFVRADVFDYDFPRHAHDSALVGFLFSHLSEEQEQLLVSNLRDTVRPGADVLILESAWTEVRARFNQKVEHQRRRLNDGTEFPVYKRYISRDDVGEWTRKHGLTATIQHFGAAFCAISVRFAERSVSERG